MLLLAFAGLIAGFVDSIIGGGGLIALPAVMLQLGVRPEAIGTNKIAGAAATLAAACVYGLGKKMPWRAALEFAGWVGAGSVTGAVLSPRALQPLYPVLLGLGTGLCLAAVAFRKRLVLPAPAHAFHGLSWKAKALGLACGFYDGAWGPGGGTFMFLALLYSTPVGLVGAIAAAKVANLASASLSLVTYAAQGLVHWRLGAALGLALAAGALAGAGLALKHADRLAFPLLTVVSSLMLLKLALG